jgi:hypothetical protein
MTDLRVSVPVLHQIGNTVSGTASTVKFGSALARPGDDVLQSATVAAALSTSAKQQSTRAELVAATLDDIARSPATAAAAYLAADSDLAAKAR